MQPRERATFDATELAVVLSHYKLGVIESVTELPRGSRRSPKVGLVCGRGKFLLKRRTLDPANPDRILFTHRLHEYLEQRSFPVAKLIRTRDQERSYVQIREHLYELFEFVPGGAFGQTVEESRDAGGLLAQFHSTTETFDPPHGVAVPQGDYHDSQTVRAGIGLIGSSLRAHDSFAGDEAELAALLVFCSEAYDAASEAANKLGLVDWPQRLIHADWHPGNLLFRSGRAIAVVDHDSARLSRRVLDVANGALHFSLLAGEDPTTWPDHLDQDRLYGFLGGYTRVLPMPQNERASLWHLMAETLIAECVAPIAATGSVGRWSGIRMLRMVRRKLTWLRANADRLTQGLPHE